MDSSEIRKRYLDFFKERGHAVIPSSSLVPENDPTTLFTGSGMQPLLPYLLGEKHSKGIRLVNSQKCFRAEDIEEVGDNRHTTFFEMLGNWSLGDYFKQEQLSWFFEFLTKEVGLKPERLYVTVFSGGYGISKDDESILIWKKLFGEHGINVEYAEMNTEEEGAKRGMKGDERIFGYCDKNWWSRAGTPEKMPAGEPGGPDSEVFYEFTQIEHDKKFGEHCHPNCDCGRFMEIGNSVFMEYLKQKDGSFISLPQKNVDFGGGLERIAAASGNNPDVFKINVFSKIIDQIEAFSGTSYEVPHQKKSFRVIADHIRGAVFMIGDGVRPGNTEQGYFARRLIRRAVRFTDSLNIKSGALAGMATIVSETYRDHYSNLLQKAQEIALIINKEELQFRKTLESGLKYARNIGFFEFDEVSNGKVIRYGDPRPEDLFELYTTYGFPPEMAIEELEKVIKDKEDLLVEHYKTDRWWTAERKEKLLEGFQDLMKKHQELSRAGAEQKFKGGLADGGAETTKLHTATHLMLAGLRKHLGNHVHQAGSNVTAERARFDFTHPEKVGRETLDKVEQYVNDAIAAGAERILEEMPKEEAKTAGIEGSFWEKYPDVVSVYTFKDMNRTIWSQELCGGPHVLNTKELGEGGKKFKIQKEEAVSAGVRRVKAVLD